MCFSVWIFVGSLNTESSAAEFPSRHASCPQLPIMAHNNQQLGLPLDQHQELQVMQNAQAVALNQWLEQFESTIVAAQAEQQKLNADCDAARDDQMQQLVAAMADLQNFV